MNGWKITSIILIVVLILETLLIVWVWSYGTEIIEQETECIYNICNGIDDVSYIYYEFEEICECYNGDYELTKSEYLGGKK